MTYFLKEFDTYSRTIQKYFKLATFGKIQNLLKLISIGDKNKNKILQIKFSIV